MEYEYSNGQVPEKAPGHGEQASFMDGLSKMLTLGLADILDMAAPDESSPAPQPTTLIQHSAPQNNAIAQAKVRRGKLVQSSGPGLQKRLTDDTEQQDRQLKQPHRANGSAPIHQQHLQLEAGYENVEYQMDSPSRGPSKGILDVFVTGVSSFKQKATTLLDTLDASFEMMFHAQDGHDTEDPNASAGPSSPFQTVHSLPLSPRSTKTHPTGRPSAGSTRTKLNARPLVQQSSSEIQGKGHTPGGLGGGRSSRSPRHSGEVTAGSTHRIPVIVPCKSKGSTPREADAAATAAGGGGVSATTTTATQIHSSPDASTQDSSPPMPNTGSAPDAQPAGQPSEASCEIHGREEAAGDHVKHVAVPQSVHAKHMLDPSCPGCVHSKKLLVRASKKCQGLVDENHRLRGAALLDPALSDSVCYQLESLLADKAQLLLDKCRLQREVAGLQQLLAYTWDHYLSHVDSQQERDAEQPLPGLVHTHHHHHQPADQDQWQQQHQQTHKYTDNDIAAALMSMASQGPQEPGSHEHDMDADVTGGYQGVSSGNHQVDTTPPPELVHRLATLLGESSRLQPGRALHDEVEAVERYYSSLLESLTPSEPPPHHVEHVEHAQHEDDEGAGSPVPDPAPGIQQHQQQQPMCQQQLCFEQQVLSHEAGDDVDAERDTCQQGGAQQASTASDEVGQQEEVTQQEESLEVTEADGGMAQQADADDGGDASAVESAQGEQVCVELSPSAQAACTIEAGEGVSHRSGDGVLVPGVGEVQLVGDEEEGDDLRQGSAAGALTVRHVPSQCSSWGDTGSESGAPA